MDMNSRTRSGAGSSADTDSRASTRRTISRIFRRDGWIPRSCAPVTALKATRQSGARRFCRGCWTISKKQNDSASSWHHAWVDTHAKRLGIFHHFDKVICADDVGVGRTKPNPDLFLTTLNQLQVRKDEAVVFEDSPNGVKAANRAGIFVVAVPN